MQAGAEINDMTWATARTKKRKARAVAYDRVMVADMREDALC